MTTPLNIAVDGYLCELNTLSISSNGYLCTVYIEDVEEGKPNDGYIVKGGKSTQIRRKEREKREKERYYKDHKDTSEKPKPGEVLKMITIIITKNGEDFIESKMIRAKPNLTVKDIDIQVDIIDQKPKITIELIKK